MEIKAENIANPPEKMRLMYEAVSELLRGNGDLRSLKVHDITSRAGIGKGTAYEYFPSKEELLAHALLYEYSIKIQSLVESVFAAEGFRARVYRIMDWIDENREYNQMFTQTLNVLEITSQSAGGCNSAEEYVSGDFQFEASAYIYEKVDEIMEAGYQEGVFTETDINKRGLAILTGMTEYGVAIMGKGRLRYRLEPDALRDYIYCSVIKTLSE